MSAKCMPDKYRLWEGAKKSLYVKLRKRGLLRYRLYYLRIPRSIQVTELTDVAQGTPNSEDLVLGRSPPGSSPIGSGGPRGENGVDKQVPQELRPKEFAEKS